jgi:hypothetical protein
MLMLIMEREEAEGEPSATEIGATTGVGTASALLTPPPAPARQPEQQRWPTGSPEAVASLHH